MKQNKYDDPKFFTKYSQMARSVEGLDAAGEWNTFRALLPDLRDKKVLDLGCGFGWHCRYAREQQARSVVGIDLSESMLARAKNSTHDSAIEYRRGGIEDIDFSSDEFEVVLSSLALHYVKDFDVVCRKVQHCLAVGGAFVFSVEHPVYTAHSAQDWCYGSQGERLHWILDHYQDEDARHTKFLGEDVVKYHRTVATYINTLIQSGFKIKEVQESKASIEMIEKDQSICDENRRPMFLLMSAVAEPVSC